MKLFFRMRHGLGDNCQFTIVIKHLKHYFPDCHIDMEVGPGKESYFNGLINQIYHRKIDKWDVSGHDNYTDVIWPIPKKCHNNVPSSKPTQFIKEVLGLEPIEELYKKYEVAITEKEQKLADEYVSKLPNRPFVLFHYLTKTLKFKKSLDEDQAKEICLALIEKGYTPVVLDWKNESTLPDQVSIFNPGVDDPIWEGQKLSSSGTIAALIKRAKYYIGVDSGPLHIAGATDTPSIGLWSMHHPINFFDLAPNVTHFVSNEKNGLQFIKGRKKRVAKKYFEEKYNHIYYDNLLESVLNYIRNKL